MRYNKNAWKNLNIYTALGLIPIFLYFSNLFPMSSPLIFQNKILNLLITIIELFGAGASLVFVITKIFSE